MNAINPNLLWLLFGTFAALSVGTAIRWIALKNSATEVVKKRLGSLAVWWALALLWSIAAVLGQPGATVLFAIASAIGMREYLRFLGTPQQIGHVAIAGLILLGVSHYLLIAIGYSETVMVGFPIIALLLFGAIRETTCDPKGFVRTTAGLFWGSMLMIYALSHALLLFELDRETLPLVGPAGGFLFLVLMTELNDIMQAVVGRKFGKNKITPGVSPNKSLEGLLGGMLATTCLAIALAPFLTTFSSGQLWYQGAITAGIAGVLISVSGFLGDINMSAIKRDTGVKDGSNLLPGMGGVIDRIDSLIFTAPVFYYFRIFVDQLG